MSKDLWAAIEEAQEKHGTLTELRELSYGVRKDALEKKPPLTEEEKVKASNAITKALIESKGRILP